MERSRVTTTVLIVAVCIATATVMPFVYDAVMDRVSGHEEVSLGSDSGILSVEGDGRYRTGDVATVTADVRNGYCFIGWYDDSGTCVSNDRCYSFVASSIHLSARSEQGYTVSALKTSGIAAVTGGGPHRSGSAAVLTADVLDDFIFMGWYDQSGRQLSDELSFSPEQKDGFAIARTFPVYSDSSAVVDMGPWPSWYDDRGCCIVYDWFSGDYVNSCDGENLSKITVPAGMYGIDYYSRDADGAVHKETRTVSVDGPSFQHYVWYTDGAMHQIDLSMDCGTYSKYQDLIISRAPLTDVLRYQYMKCDSPSMQRFSDAMAEETRGMTDLQRADCVLDFVQQCIVYETDAASRGVVEYWKFPFETLVEHRGDCEDQAILYATLMHMMGYDSAVLLFMGDEYKDNAHVSAAVAVDEDIRGGTFYEHKGKKYYFCETTSSYFDVGDPVPLYRNPSMMYLGEIPLNLDDIPLVIDSA